MASVAFPSISKITRLPNGTTYNYVFVEPKGNKPYILFLHGFPSSSFDWRHQISFFSNAGYGVIVPDLLGYGGTDKPEVLEAYRLKSMSDDMASLLDHLQVKEVFGVGHDWYGIKTANTNPVLAYALFYKGLFPTVTPGKLSSRSVYRLCVPRHWILGSIRGFRCRRHQCSG